MEHRGTKIVATIGPASSSPTVLRRLLRAGVDVARINCSHGDHASHAAAVAAVRREARRVGREVAVLGDLQGPKIRTGRLAGDEPVALVRGRKLVITSRRVVGNAGIVSTGYRRLPAEVKRGDRILIDDGLLELRVQAVDGADIATVVERGGLLKNNKGICVPGVTLSAGAITAKDRRDLAFLLGLGVDMVALSFVRSHRDVRALKRLIAKAGSDTPVIAKIERREAIDDLDAILRETGAVMVARGDLGVEVPPERVPVLQKQIVDAALDHGVPVITATQMLESMTVHARPTRAEASDVATAVFDGTDAVMLSGETAAGAHPVGSVRVMAAIVREAEGSPYYRGGVDALESTHWPQKNVAAICRAAVTAQRKSDARCMIVITQSGFTASLIAKLRPRVPVYAVSASAETVRRCSLLWGVRGLHVEFGGSSDEMLAHAEAAVAAARKLRRPETAVVVAGELPWEGGSNGMKICSISR
jgi:pyruvate kinase